MDDQMNPEARRVIELTRAARTARVEDKERVRRALAMGLAATAVGAPAVAVAGSAVTAAKAVGFSTALKLALSVAVVASVGVTSYLFVRDPQPAATVVAPAPAPVVAVPVAPEPAPEPVVAPEAPVAAPLDVTDPLLAEVALLNNAQQAWRVGNARRALELAQKHADRYPRSTLAIERDALRVFTLCALGRKAQARPLAAALIKRAPRSPLRTSVQESCGMR